MTSVSAAAMEKITITIPKNVKRIDTQYKGRTDIETVILHPGVKKICDGAFEGCTNLRNITIPGSVESIGEKAFYGCTSLEKFIIEGNSRYTVVDGVIFDGNDLVAYPAGRRDQSYTVPEQTEDIYDHSFNGNPYLKDIRLGENVYSLTGYAFLGCRNLTKIEVSEDNLIFHTDGPLLIRTDNSELVFCPPGAGARDLCFQDITSLGPACLSECTKLRQVILSECVEKIDGDAFGDRCRPRKICIAAGMEADLPPDLEFDTGAIGGNSYLFRKGIYRMAGEFEFNGYGANEFENEDDQEEEGFPCMFPGTRFTPVKVSDVKLSDIAGLEDAKTIIRNHLILPSRRPELFKRFDLESSTGVLLYGPPGTGKTMLARAVAAELDADFFSIKPADIRCCMVGESEYRMKKLFATARKSPRAVIFFDDFDSIGRARGNESEPWQGDLIAELLTQMQGLETYEGTLMVMAATNRPWDIDSALMRSGRFAHRICVGLPGFEAREEIFRNRLSKIPCGYVNLAVLADLTVGFNGADIEEMINRAKMHRIVAIENGDTVEELTEDDLSYALDNTVPTVSARDLEEIENYRRTGNGPGQGEGTYVPKDDRIDGYN